MNAPLIRNIFNDSIILVPLHRGHTTTNEEDFMNKGRMLTLIAMLAIAGFSSPTYAYPGNEAFTTLPEGVDDGVDKGCTASIQITQFTPSNFSDGLVLLEQPEGTYHGWFHNERSSSSVRKELERVQNVADIACRTQRLGNEPIRCSFIHVTGSIFYAGKAHSEEITPYKLKCR